MQYRQSTPQATPRTRHKCHRRTSQRYLRVWGTFRACWNAQHPHSHKYGIIDNLTRWKSFLPSFLLFFFFETSRTSSKPSRQSIRVIACEERISRATVPRIRSLVTYTSRHCRIRDVATRICLTMRKFIHFISLALHMFRQRW